MAFVDILQEARRRVPLANSEPLPWPEEPEHIHEEAMCACGHPYEKHDSKGGCQVPKGASEFGYESLCQCEGFALSAFRQQPAGEPSP